MNSKIERAPRGDRIGRRTLIKRAAATGAVAWTAPLILDSVASPAGAQTAASCVLVRITPATPGCSNKSLEGWDNSLCCNCASSGWPTATSGTETPFTTCNVASGTLSNACITGPENCGDTTNTITFTISSTGTMSGSSCACTNAFFHKAGTRADKCFNTGGEACYFDDTHPTFVTKTASTVTFNRTASTGGDCVFKQFFFVVGCSTA